MAFKLSKDKIKEVQKIAINKYISKNDILKKAQIIKKQMIEEFNAHPVTMEILAGPTSSNISRTLFGTDGGNLYSFIGFPAGLGTSPIQNILNKLNSISIELNKQYDNFYLSIKMPLIEEIWDVTPMPWQEGRSWAKGIESGISGLNYYLYGNFKENDYSRSGTGVQTHKIRSYARYVPTQYISTLFKKYRTKFSSLYKKNTNIFTFVE